jgi:hypothetical protein
MTNSKRTASLDEVLADYAHASQEFDAKVLQAFIDKYPEHARALQRYAHIQLTSMPATPDEVDEESLSDEEMLPRQSKLLQRMQQLRRVPSASDASEAAGKLASISGEQAMRAAAIAVFGSCEHGEDLLLLSITESVAEVRGVPDWFYEELGTQVGAAPAALIAGMAMKRQQPAGLQRFSAKGKPTEPPPMTWEQAVEDCITDDAVKNAILKR